MNQIGTIITNLKNNKPFRAIVICSLISFVSIIPIMCMGEYMNQGKVDVYWFATKSRWPENIVFDVCERSNTILFLYIVYFQMSQKPYKGYALCFLIIAMAQIPYYFLFYSLYFSTIFIPVLLIMLLIVYRKNKHEQRNNLG